jgi:hypothetical protein
VTQRKNSKREEPPTKLKSIGENSLGKLEEIIKLRMKIKNHFWRNKRFSLKVGINLKKINE